MTVVVTRPDATVANGASSLTGAASRHAALSDDSDASYVSDPTEASRLKLGLVEPTIPAGAIVKSYGLRVRTALAAAGGLRTITMWLYDSAVAIPGAPRFLGVGWTTPTTIGTGVVNTGALANPTALTIELAGLVRFHELYLDTTYVAKPVVDPTTPTGTVTNTNQPVANWTNTLDSDGGVQTKYEVRYFTAAQYGIGGFDPATSPATAESGILTGSATTWTPSAPIANATYRAYVRTGQTVNGTTHWSDWAFEGFVLNVTPPNAPGMVLTAQPDDGRIKIDLDDAAAGVSTELFEVERSDDGGSTWASIRTLTGDGRITPASGLATAYDYEAPNGVEVSYRARALHSYSGIYAASAWTTDSETWTGETWWIKHPTTPSLNVAVMPFNVPTIARASRQGVFSVLGARLPIVVGDVRGAPAGTITIEVDTEEDQGALATILDGGGTLLLQGREGDHWTDRWVRFGAQETERMVDKLGAEPTFETLEWTEVVEPTGALESWT